MLYVAYQLHKILTICCRCIHAVKPFLDAELISQFVDRKLEETKGKRIQQRHESNIRGFHDTLTNTSEKWSVGEWPIVLKQLHDLNAFVDR